MEVSAIWILAKATICGWIRGQGGFYKKRLNPDDRLLAFSKTQLIPSWT